MRQMRIRPGKRRGESFTELMLALLILGLVMASAFDFLAGELRFIEKLRRFDGRQWDLQKDAGRNAAARIHSR